MTQKFKVKNYPSPVNLQEGINEMAELGYKPILMTEREYNTSLRERFTVVFEFGIHQDELLKKKEEAISLESSN